MTRQQSTLIDLAADLSSILGDDARIVVDVDGIEYEITGVSRRPGDAYIIQTGSHYQSPDTSR